MRPEDWPAIRAIYEAGIATGDATFETAAPDWPAWDAAHLAGHRLVARDDDGQVVGWPPWPRCRVVGVRERLGQLHGRPLAGRAATGRRSPVIA